MRQGDVGTAATERMEIIQRVGKIFRSRFDRCVVERNALLLGKCGMNARREAVGYRIAEYCEVLCHVILLKACIKLYPE